MADRKSVGEIGRAQVRLNGCGPFFIQSGLFRDRVSAVFVGLILIIYKRHLHILSLKM
jgi:hypothetical protein